MRLAALRLKRLVQNRLAGSIERLGDIGATLDGNRAAPRPRDEEVFGTTRP